MSIYVDFNENEGFPIGKDLYYECRLCGDVMHSKVKNADECTCGNLSIDSDYCRVSVRKKETVKLIRKVKS